MNDQTRWANRRAETGLLAALLCENGRVIDLGGTFSQAFAINNRGQIVGVTSGALAETCSPYP